MSIPSSELKSWLHSEIFNYIPLNIAVIDRDYNVVEANNNFREYFGSWESRKCYSVYKGRKTPCNQCKAVETFADGQVRSHEEEGCDAKGNLAYYVVNTAPVTAPDGTITHVIEMSRNITDIHQQQREYQILFERVPCYIAILDRDLKIVRANEKLHQVFGECHGKHCYEVYKKRDTVCEDCPALTSFRDGKECSSTHVGVAADGKETQYVVTTSPLSRRGVDSTHIVEIMTDITHLKLLEKEKLEAERLAAVGETVAGLAHSVKNILMGIEGGMYMLGSGFKKDDKERIGDGWGILQKNITKVTALVKTFLSFAKGRQPQMQMVDPHTLIDEIFELYWQTAENMGVTLVRGRKIKIDAAPLDAEGMHTCLTNLVSNAIDACRAGNNPQPTVELNVWEADGIIKFEVRDSGCGVDYEIKKKVFTTFFTTKGGEGTGLGLLTTRKIVQEHGGKIYLESTPGKGAIFRIELPRHRLMEIQQEVIDESTRA